MDQYFGTYQTFSTVSKKDAGILLGADNLVGDVYDIDIRFENDKHCAWLTNRFNQTIGFFDPDFSRQLSIFKARGLSMKALLSFIAYTDAPDPGFYWGEMAVICYKPSEEEVFSMFIRNIGKKMGDGIRPQVDLKSEGITRIIESKGEWTPEQTTPMPKLGKGTVIMKDKLSASEKMIEQGREGNKGCYVVSWAFIIAVVIGILVLAKSCGLF